MSDEWAAAPPPRAPRKWPRRLLWTFCGLLLFMVVTYFVVTSHFFLESFILPRVSDAIHATVTVGDSSISPFFKVTLDDVKVKTTVMEDPLLTAKEIHASYSLIDILRGNINVDDVTIDSPVIQIVQYADGSRNIDRVLKAMSSGKPSSPSPSKPGPPPHLDVKNLLLTNATVRLVRNSMDGTREVAEVANVVFKSGNFRNGGTAKFNFGTDIKLDKTPGQVRPNTPSSLLLAKVGANFECGFSPDLQPVSLIGGAWVDVLQAPDAYKELAGLHAGLDCTLTPTQLTQLSFSLLRNNKPLGQLNLSGPLDIANRQGRVKLEVSGIDRQVLNVLGAALGLDFGSTTISSREDIELSNAAQLINVTGRFSANKLSVARQGAKSKPVDLQLDYKLSLNLADQTALISAFTLTGTQDQSPLIRGALTRPMKLSFASTSVPDDSAFDLVVTNLNLADWSAFIGDYAGIVGLHLNVAEQQGGRHLKLDLSAAATELSANLAGRKIEQSDLSITVRGGMDDFNKVQLDEYNIRLLRQNQPVLAVSGTGSYELKAKNASLDTRLDASLADLATLLSLPDLKASSGTVKLSARVVQSNLTPNNTNNPILDQSVSGSVLLDNFTGQYSANRFERFGGSIDFDAEKKDQAVEIRKLVGALNQEGRGAGSFAVSGNYNVAGRRGDARASVLDLNQNALQPFLAPLLGDMTLASANINVNATVAYDAKGESSLQGDFKLADFLVSDPAGQLPKVPLTAEMRVDAAMRDNVAKIGEFSGRIDQGDQPGGSFDVSGSYDLQKQSGQVALKVTDVNQNALRPLLASKLGDQTLKSVSISAATTASYDARGDSTLTGEIHLSNFLMTGAGSPPPKAPLSTDVSLDVLLRDRAAEIRNLTGNIALGGAPGGGIALSGKYDMQKQSGQAAFKITDLNQNALSPFLGSALGGKTLTSVSINADATAAYDAGGESAVKGQFGIANLLVTDPDGKLPKTPLSLGLQLDAGMTAKVLRLGQLQLTWFNQAGKTQILLGGKVDMTKPDAIAGDLQISSDAIELTPLYDLMSSPAKTNATKTTASPRSAPASASASNGADVEPAPVKLPFQQFTVDATIKQLTLREVAVRDFHTTLLLDGGHLNLKPFEFTLNEAPVSATADVNLEIPGYEYALTFSADHVPMEPVVNTFAPAEHGHVRGDLIAKADIHGAGVTGRSLKQNLAGQVAVTTDKADIELVPKGVSSFLVPIAFLLQMPSLTNSPIVYVNANVQTGGGIIKVSQFDLNSRAFALNTQGDIPIADVLTNSPLQNIPVHFSLERSLATQLGAAPASLSTNADYYVPLPDFITVTGTLGKADAKVSKTAIAGILLRSRLTGQTPSLNTPTLNNPVSTPSLNTPSMPSVNTPSMPSAPSMPSMPSTPSVPSINVPTIKPF
jgi:hypothetical protein